jgi:hypothetical protein
VERGGRLRRGREEKWIEGEVEEEGGTIGMGEEVERKIDTVGEEGEEEEERIRGGWKMRRGVTCTLREEERIGGALEGSIERIGIDLGKEQMEVGEEAVAGQMREEKE